MAEDYTELTFPGTITYQTITVNVMLETFQLWQKTRELQFVTLLFQTYFTIFSTKLV